MVERQIKLLKKLYKKIQAEKKNRVKVIVSLQSAKILTKKENFTNHLKNLNKIFIQIK